MWQKIFCLCFLFLLPALFTKTYAQTIEVESLTEFTTAEPPTSISVKLIDPLELTGEFNLKPGVILQGNLIDVVSPKRLKRDASFSFVPVSYIDIDGKLHELNNEVVASYNVPIDKKALAKTAALGVGSYFVKGLSIGAAAIEGAVKNEEDNRLKSSAVSAYEASPISYVEKGEDIQIKEHQSFFLKFPDNGNNETKNDNEPNYTYTLEKE